MVRRTYTPNQSAVGTPKDLYDTVLRGLFQICAILFTHVPIGDIIIIVLSLYSLLEGRKWRG